MSIPTVVTTTVPSIVNTTTAITSAIPSVVSAIPSMTSAATSVANAVPSMVNAGSSIASAINSLPPLPSMNSMSNTASNIGSSIVSGGSSIVSGGSNIANSAMEKGKEAISLIDKLMRDLASLFTLRGLHNLSYFLLNIFVILILIHLITKKEDAVPKLHLYGLYVCGFCFIIFYILSYIFEDDKKKHDKSDLSTQPIVVK